MFQMKMKIILKNPLKTTHIFGAVTFPKTALAIMGLIATLSINYTKANDTQHSAMLSVIMFDAVAWHPFSVFITTRKYKCFKIKTPNSSKSGEVCLPL
jgi:hypothetical protein